MLPRHLRVESFPVIWGEMLNAEVFSLRQERQNKMTKHQFKKNKTKKMAAVFASGVEANPIQSGSWDLSAFWSVWRPLLESGRILPEFSQWTECTFVDVLRAAETPSQCVGATWRRS